MLKKITIAIVAVVVLITGGTYIYIHFINGDAEAELSVNTDTTSTSAVPAPTDFNGNWTVASGSQAGYRVNEVLFGQSTTAVGRTNDVTGSMNIANNSVTSVNVVVDMTTVTSDESRRDNQFNNRIMATDVFPTAKFVLTTPIALEEIPADGKVLTKQVTGTFTVRGTEKTVTFPIEAKRNGGLVSVSGSVDVNFDEWGIPNPSFGVAETEDHGKIEFLVNFTKS